MVGKDLLIVAPASASETCVNFSPVGVVAPGAVKAMGFVSLHWPKPTMPEVML